VRLAVFLLCAAAVYGQTIDEAQKARDRAAAAMEATRQQIYRVEAQEAGASESELFALQQRLGELQLTLAEQRREFVESGDVLDHAIAAEMRSRTAEFEALARDLEGITERIHVLAVCRRSRHRWQFWKRCRY